MFSFLLNCLQKFGINGILVYLKIKFNHTASISLPSLKFPISMRPTNIDKITFREIFIRKEYEINLPASITPTVIIDAGANIGFTSIFFANKYPQATIISIEPDAHNFEFLKENTAFYPSIHPLKNAVWHKKEVINVVDKGYGDRGFMIEQGEGAVSLEGTSITDVMQHYQLQHIDILKMDIEGSEKEVFTENYDFWLSRTKCLIIEIHDRMKKGCSKAVFDAVNKYDFSLSISGENFVFIKNEYL